MQPRACVIVNKIIIHNNCLIFYFNPFFFLFFLGSVSGIIYHLKLCYVKICIPLLLYHHFSYMCNFGALPVAICASVPVCLCAKSEKRNLFAIINILHNSHSHLKIFLLHQDRNLWLHVRKETFRSLC